MIDQEVAAGMCTDKEKALAGMLQIMNGFRSDMREGRYVIVCTKPGAERKVGQLTTFELAPIHYLDGYVFTPVEAAQRAVEDLKVGVRASEAAAAAPESNNVRVLYPPGGARPSSHARF